MMQQCPKCGSSEIIPELRIHDGETRPIMVDIVEPEPAKRPFIWMAQNARSHFKVRGGMEIVDDCTYRTVCYQRY